MRMVITREGFFFCFTCYLDAAQTLALTKDQSVDNPSQDQLKVNPPPGGFFCCTERPLLCTCAWWTARTFYCLIDRSSPSLKVLGSPQTRDRVTLLCSLHNRVPFSERVSLGCSTSCPQFLQLALSWCVCVVLFPPIQTTVSKRLNF